MKATAKIAKKPSTSQKLDWSQIILNQGVYEPVGAGENCYIVVFRHVGNTSILFVDTDSNVIDAASSMAWKSHWFTRVEGVEIDVSIKS